MNTLISIAAILTGVSLVLWGADRFTDGAAALAKRMNVPTMVIGLTVVAFGTSAPELFVSTISAMQGAPGMSIGNIVGSNIFNILLIIGVSAVICPIAVKKTYVTKDMVWMAIATVILPLLCLDHYISIPDGLLMLLLFAAFMAYTLHMAKKSNAEEQDPISADTKLWKSIAYILLGLACLIIGSHLFVTGASAVATMLGVSEAIVGLTIVAGGTSLPELATSVVAARKGQSALALGNVIGSNVFNVLLILGLTGTICPISSAEITTIDFLVFTASAAIFWLFSRTGYKLSRLEGITFILAFIAYIIMLILQSTNQ